MWLKLSWDHWRRLLGQQAPNTRPQPDRLKCLQLFRRLQPAVFHHYSARLGQTIPLAVLYPRIDQYTDALKEASQMVRLDRAIPADWPSREEHRVSLDRFLTSMDGYYLNPQDVVTRFQSVAVELCEAMEASDELTYGVPEHNLRMLTRVLINLQTVAQALLDASNAPRS